MTIYLHGQDIHSTLELEQQVIQRIPECEVSTVIHHEAYIYRNRTGPSMVNRAVAILLASCDIAIIIEENEFLEKICKLIGIPVYRSLDEVLDTPVEADTLGDISEDGRAPDLSPSSWCQGCDHSGMSPVETPVVSCNHFDELFCHLFDSMEEALEG